MRPKLKQPLRLGIRTLSLAAALLLAASCQFPLALWIIPGARAHDLLFGISEHRNGTEAVRLSSIRVFRCSDIYERGEFGSYPCPGEEVWKAAADDIDRTPSITRIVYGETPAALQASAAPSALEIPGCYVVLAYALDSRGDLRSATIGFRVLADGSVEEMSRRAYERVFSRRKAA
jgi:hypothetical protein